MISQITETRDLNVLVFPSLSDHRLVHGIFDRSGGISPKPLDSLNVGLHCGDKMAKVMENRDRIKKALGFKHLVALKQVHGAKVCAISKLPVTGQEIENHDAVITDLTGIGLMIQQADCQAVLLFDPIRPAVGIAHVGWRGSVAEIIKNTVAAMQQNYGTNPENLRAAISPSLGPCCAEFKNFRDELPEHFHAHQVRPNYFDFWAISREQLQACGVMAGHIETAGKCTFCDKNFFSYRRDRVCGRNASIIGLR